MDIATAHKTNHKIRNVSGAVLHYLMSDIGTGPPIGRGDVGAGTETHFAATPSVVKLLWPLILLLLLLLYAEEPVVKLTILPSQLVPAETSL